MNSQTTRRIALLAAAAALALTGCAGQVPGASQPGEPDVRTLKAGNYSTEPLELRARYKHSVDGGAELAAMRLADHVVTGSDIDPQLRYRLSWQTLSSAWQATLYDDLLTETTQQVLTRHGMLFGFSSAATASADDDLRQRNFHADPQTPAQRSRVAVFQFPDEDAARRAAAELDSVDFAVAADQNQPVTLPNYPGALAHWRPDWPTIGTTLAHGRYVVSVFLRLPSPDLPALTALAEKTYAAQLPRLDALKPLSAEEVLLLDADPQGMLRRTLNPNGENKPYRGHLAVGLQGFLHTRKDRGAKEIYAKAGADLFGIHGVEPVNGVGLSPTVTIRTRDDAAAKTLLRDLLPADPRTVEPPAGLPDAVCVDESKPANQSRKLFSCLVRYRNYVAQVASNQPEDARQRATAQYALFANSQ